VGRLGKLELIDASLLTGREALVWLRCLCKGNNMVLFLLLWKEGAGRAKEGTTFSSHSSASNSNSPMQMSSLCTQYVN
jgi:hypothetical protein